MFLDLALIYVALVKTRESCTPASCEIAGLSANTHTLLLQHYIIKPGSLPSRGHAYLHTGIYLQCRYTYNGSHAVAKCNNAAVQVRAVRKDMCLKVKTRNSLCMSLCNL